jgi:hypothetical protein
MDESVIDFVLSHRFIVIYGQMGSGRTLTGVGLLALSKAKNIVSNTSLYGIEHAKFDLASLFDYKDKIIFWDMADYAVNNSRNYRNIHDNIRGFIEELQENNNHLIVTIVDRSDIEPDIRKLVDMWIMTCYEQLFDIVRLYIQVKGKKELIFANLGNVSQWFKNYQTLNMPGSEVFHV